MPDLDRKWMGRALELAKKKGRYVSPNPRVGAVLVKSGRMVGEGGHQKFGGPHAEIIALKKAGARAMGSTLYVTLEPCSHFGKTPPCTDALIRSGVKKVVAAMRDPFPLVKGEGFKKLRKAGIQVKYGVLEEEARSLNEPFLFSIKNRRPRVWLKAAVSLDGKIATVSGKSKWITGDKARRWVHEMRSKADAILVGSGTARMDDPSLTVRSPGYDREDGWPMRVLLDGRFRISPKAKIFQGKPRTVVFTSMEAPQAAQRILEKKGILVFRVPKRGKMLSLKAVLRVLHSLDVRTLMVEGGGQVHASFLAEGLADKVYLFLSPKIFGGDAPSWVGGKGVENPNLASNLKHVRMEKVGEDILLTGRMEE